MTVQRQLALMVFKALNDPLCLLSAVCHVLKTLKGLYKQIKCPFTKNQLPKKEL